MKKDEKQLWQKIEGFRLDDPEAGFQFSARLARENGWSLKYSHRVIAEYKKFIFMCCVSESGVTPSDPVDQAWHLHLTFTKSYWQDLCRDTIGKEIHHNPTKGGKQEAEKFNKFYTSSHQLYQDKFGMLPPADIWQNNHARFADIDFQRVNMSKYWLIRKPKLSVAGGTLLMVLIACATLIQASGDVATPIIMFIIFTIIGVSAYQWQSDPNKRKGDSNGGSGCSTAGCGGDGGSHHGGSHDGGHHGGDSGCSGCSSSGCSGCGGGCGGGGD